MLWGEVSLRRAQNKLENFSAVGTIVHYVHNLAVVLCISKSMYCGLKNGEIVGKNFPIFPQQLCLWNLKSFGFWTQTFYVHFYSFFTTALCFAIIQCTCKYATKYFEYHLWSCSRARSVNLSFLNCAYHYLHIAALYVLIGVRAKEPATPWWY